MLLESSERLIAARPIRLLHLEDSADDAKLVALAVERAGVQVLLDRVEDLAAMRVALGGCSYDVVLSDWSAPRFTAIAALALLAELGLDLPLIVVSRTAGEETAVLAMRAGARDFLVKARLGGLAAAVERELQGERTRQDRKLADEEALRRGQSQLRHGQKMEAIGRLAGGIAHDFNNMLSVILSYGELMLGELSPGDPMREEVGEIRKAAKRAADLTRQLLTFSRPHVAGERALDLNEVLASMDRMLRQILGEDVALVSSPSPALGAVKADLGSIEQVILNLVVNARDAMPTGGRLTIETANVELDEQYARSHLGVAAGPYVTLCVSDTGAGMDAATQARIFEPFFTTKESGRGTGLGLSTVFGIVQHCGGSIRVRSRAGAGTAFTIYFPGVVQKAVGSRRTDMPAATVRGIETVLLVEDDEQVRVVARGILRRHGYSVLDAGSAGEAVLLSEGHPGTIDLLLSDVVMPQMSGPRLAERLLQARPDLKVLCMSGHSENALVQHAVPGAPRALLQKPFTPETLTRRVRDVLDGDAITAVLARAPRDLPSAKPQATRARR